MKKLLLAASIAGIGLMGCGQQQATTTNTEQAEVKVDTVEIIRSAADRYLSTAPQNLRVLAPDWLMEKIKSGSTDDIFIIDVRGETDYAEGHVPGATNIPFKTVAKPDNLSKLPKTKQIVVVCKSGQTASMINAILNMLGYNAVTLKGGMHGWTAANGPVEK